jgi:deazaflavin-dependent oxidoreductase (nitroreductase family)
MADHHKAGSVGAENIENQRRYRWCQSLVQKFAVTRVGAWFFAQTARPADTLVYKLSGGRTTLASIVSGIPVVILTTTGARSGLPRTSPVLFVADPTGRDRFAVIASNLGQPHRPAWYYNLKANPRAVCSRAGRSRAYLAREAIDDEYTRFWQAATAIYPGYQVYRQRARNRYIPIMVLEPEDLR